MLAGCGGMISKVDTNTLVIGKDEIEDIAVEDYSDLDVSKEALETYINEQISKFQAAGSGTVTMEDVKLRDGIAKLSMTYDSIDTYNAFNGTEYEMMPASEWKYDKELLDKLSAIDGKSLDEKEAEALMSDEENQVLIVPVDTDVLIKGSILAFCGGTYKEENTLHATEGAVIIFR